MRRFFHRKGAQPRCPTSPGVTQPASSTSPTHAGAATPTGRVRAPALRSRSMSVLNGPAVVAPPARPFTRSLSFCVDQGQPVSASSCLGRQLTQCEEDEMFRLYTRKVYGLCGLLCAATVALAVFAYFYNYGGRW